MPAGSIYCVCIWCINFFGSGESIPVDFLCFYTSYRERYVLIHLDALHITEVTKYPITSVKVSMNYVRDQCTEVRYRCSSFQFYNGHVDLWRFVNRTVGPATSVWVTHVWCKTAVYCNGNTFVVQQRVQRIQFTRVCSASIGNALCCFGYCWK